MSKQIYTYALIKSLYDQGKDYIDCFWPFAVKVFPTDRASLSLEAIQRSVGENFALEIPLHTLGTILKRAQRKEYIDQENRTYRLTENGLEYLGTFETDKDVDRRLNSLLDDIKQFLSAHGIPTSIDQIHGEFLSFLRKNIDPLIECFNPSGVSGQPAIPKVTGFEKYLIDYIENADRQKPEHYKILQDVVFGSVISTILSSEEPSEITEIRVRKFKHCQVFLDTNFIFSILDLHAREFNDPVKELFDLLKEYKFELKVFSFTVDEICRVINAYSREEYRYPTTIRVDTLYGGLKSKDWTKLDAKEFIMNIGDTLSNLGIKLEWVKDVDLKDYNPTDDGLRSLIRKCKPLQPLISQNHDIAAIEKIKEIRGQSARKIENSIAFFLTSDNRLSRCNFIEMGHRENGTVCEVILDRLLTNILWLKNPGAKISLKSIIEAYSRDLFVKRRIWERFYETLRRLKQEEKVKDEDISMLFYHSYIEDVLREFDDTEADEITPEFVLEKIEYASKLPKEEVERKIREKEKEFIQRLEEVREEVSKKEQEKDKEWLEKFQRVKKGLREAAESSAKRDTYILRILSVVLLAIPLIICAVTKKWDIFGDVCGIISGILAIIGLAIGGFEGKWEKVERKIANDRYGKMEKEAKLDKI